jgi:hypothetical protein
VAVSFASQHLPGGGRKQHEEDLEFLDTIIEAVRKLKEWLYFG